MFENVEALESFIGFCDDMQIAEEGLFTREVDLSSAKSASSYENVLELTKNEVSIIKLSGKIADQTKEAVKKANKNNTINGITAIGSLALNFIGPASLLKSIAIIAASTTSLIGQASNQSKYEKLSMYKLYGKKGTLYLVKKGIKVKE